MKKNNVNIKIAFVLPKPTFGVMGGYRVVYEYSNLFLKNGYDVTIYYDMKMGKNYRHIPRLLYFFLGKIVARKEPSWFPLDKGIKRKAIWSICNSQISKGDYIVATAVDTALGVSKLDESKGKKIYFVQDFENWVMNDADVYETYKLNMKIITVSDYLQNLIQEHINKKVYCVPNAIDLANINIINKIEKRDKYSIGFLYHESAHKGVKYAIKAIEKIREKYPQVTVYSFGSAEQPTFLPEWVIYYGRLSVKEVCELMNKCSIFVCASINEGFGLTGAESMAAGCALISSDYPAVHTYAENGVNALLSPVKEVDAMVLNIERLIVDDDYRCRIAYEGNRRIQSFNWENAFCSFCEAISENF